MERPNLTRTELMKTAQELLEYCMEQVRSQKPVGKEKQGWVRTGLYGVQIANSVIKDAELEEILRRIEILERGRKETG